MYRILLISCSIAAIVLILSISLISANYRYSYIGSGKCRECHGDKSLGNQYAVWLASGHSRALQVLGQDKGLKIAKKTGIVDPMKSSKCLRCHTTGRDRGDNRIMEGVGCEACHGPASEYHKPSVHVDFSYRENGYRRAIASGMYNIIGDDRLKSRERLCTGCHDEERPCYPERKEEKLHQKMTIQVVDKMMRGSADLRHPIRR